jgi:hypothetical protein
MPDSENPNQALQARTRFYWRRINHPTRRIDSRISAHAVSAFPRGVLPTVVDNYYLRRPHANVHSASKRKRFSQTRPRLEKLAGVVISTRGRDLSATLHWRSTEISRFSRNDSLWALDYSALLSSRSSVPAGQPSCPDSVPMPFKVLRANMHLALGSGM